MSLIEDILSYGSVAIIGLAKNAGKTECLNYILRNLGDRSDAVAVTSIGVDGESRDQVKGTHKPEITLAEGMWFVTSETHFHQRRLVADIRDVGGRQTSLGRLVTARVVNEGKIILSGPAETLGLRRVIADLHSRGVKTVLVDGALSRLSLGAPAVADATVLATGAALSRNIPQIVRQTRYVCDLMKLPLAPPALCNALSDVQQGVMAVTPEGRVVDLEIPSALVLEKCRDRLFAHGNVIFAAGAVSDKMLGFLAKQKNVADITLIFNDYTRMFALPETYYAFLRRGGKLQVIRKNRLLAVCINPTSPDGYTLDSDALRHALEDALDVPVCDVMKMN